MWCEKISFTNIILTNLKGSIGLTRGGGGAKDPGPASEGAWPLRPL